MLQLLDGKGEKKYLTAEERAAFIACASRTDRRVATFCLTLAHAGCRISEALSLTANRVDLEAGKLVFETLKRRRKKKGPASPIWRSVPVPPALIESLNMVHGIRELQTARGRGQGVRLWPWDRTTGWRHVKRVMEAAGIARDRMSPKTLRHSFAVHALMRDVPLNKVSAWLGHASLDTTAIYTAVSGKEEDAIAARMWS
jgi:integrase